MKTHAETIIKAQYLREMSEISKGNPRVTGDIDMVLCLSGRTTVVGKNPDALGEKRQIDPTDGLERLRLAIRIAQKASSLKGKTVEVVYNGTPDGCDDLREFLFACKDSQDIDDFRSKHPEIHKYLSDNYQAQEVASIISEFKAASAFLKVKYGVEMEDVRSESQTEIKNTCDQAKACSNYFGKDAPEHPVISVVSSAFHLPRVARAFCKAQENAPSSVFGHATLILSGTDLECTRPGTDLDLISEPSAITNYIANGTISRFVGRNVQYAASSLGMKGESSRQPLAVDDKKGLLADESSHAAMIGRESVSSPRL